GVVYGVFGLLATMAAFGTGGSSGGTKNAIAEIGEQPFGRILLGLVALGLLCYAAWRFAQAILDPDRKGHDAKGIGQRIAQAVSGTVYLLLALFAGSLALGMGAAGGSSKQAWTAWIMSFPFGQFVIGLAGLILAGVGVWHLYRAYTADFMRQYKTGEMNPTERRWALRLGQFGLAARGVAFTIIGIFLVKAAVQSDPSEAKGLGEAVSTLREQPYGPWLMGLVALGFVAYGIYCFSRARYRRIHT
ncbi:MAG: DUF1206 domain-containing protein, partial [Planctomycetaceae bacterium]